MTEEASIFASTGSGRRLQLHVHGANPARDRDLVVLEAGLGSSGASWGPVQRLLVPTVASVAYDRAGYGVSDPATGRRGLGELADDLDAVVARFPHRRVVVVGHSWGGPIARVWAGRVLSGDATGTDPRRLAGLVLVDPSDEGIHLFFTRWYRASSALENALYVPLAQVGLLRSAARATLGALPPDDLARTVADTTSVGAARAVVAENHAVVEGLSALRRNPPRLGVLPVRVVSGTKPSRLARWTRDPVVAGHRAFVAAHPGAVHVESPLSEHLVPMTDPATIVAQVQALLG